MNRISTIAKSVALLLAAGLSMGQCGPCCQEIGPSLIATGIYEPDAGVVHQNPLPFTTYVMMLDDCDVNSIQLEATASVNGGEPVDLAISLQPAGIEGGCVNRTQLILSGDLVLESGTNNVHIHVVAEEDSDVVELDDYVTYTYE